jgi:hypothetical protein
LAYSLQKGNLRSIDTRPPTDIPPDALASPTEPVSFSFRLLLTLAVTSSLITLFPVLQLLLPAQVAFLDEQHKVVSLGLITTLGGFAVLVGQHHLALGRKDKRPA